MFTRLKVNLEPKKTDPDLGDFFINQLVDDANLLPTQILAVFDINRRTWKNPDKTQQVSLNGEPGSGKVNFSAWYREDLWDEFFFFAKYIK